MTLAQATREINQQQRVRMVEKIREAVGDLHGKTIAFLGLAFKPNTDDIRDSPALSIAEQLMEGGCAVRAYDPEALEASMREAPTLIPCRDAYHTVEGVDAVVLVTEWNLFRNLDFDRIRSLVKYPIFIDLRNVYEPERMAEQGFYYVSVGRKTAGTNPLKQS
jgi:UDPglucose 6-dehydrogenase